MTPFPAIIVTMKTPEVVLRGITVAFSSNIALNAVTLSFPPGSRNAVVGENGAGKSTLMRALFGLIQPDAGDVLLGGKPQRFSSPADAIASGIGMVQQHFELIPSFTVAENIVLGAEMRRGVFLDKQGAESTVRNLAEKSGLPIDPSVRVAELSIAAQQRVEILKALYRNARILILDEPTASLAPSEASELWAATRRLSVTGTTIIFVTHKLDEVMAEADFVTVLRRGEKTFSSPVSQTTPEQIASAMVGGKTGLNIPIDNKVITPGGTRLHLEKLSVTDHRGSISVVEASLTVRAGEIVGLAGVDGSGQRELIEAVAGLRRSDRGEVSLNGIDISDWSIEARRNAGIAYIPEDRHQRALVLSFSCEENMILGRQRETMFSWKSGILNKTAIQAFFADRIAAYDVRGAEIGVPVRSLSGGNQQKLVLARELSRDLSLVAVMQPTRGLDFAAAAFVHNALRRERDRGVAVLFQSLDLQEILALSDRIAVMLSGRIVAILSRQEANETLLGQLMTGAVAS